MLRTPMAFPERMWATSDSLKQAFFAWLDQHPSPSTHGAAIKHASVTDGVNGWIPGDGANEEVTAEFLLDKDEALELGATLGEAYGDTHGNRFDSSALLS